MTAVLSSKLCSICQGDSRWVFSGAFEAEFLPWCDTCSCRSKLILQSFDSLIGGIVVRNRNERKTAGIMMDKTKVEEVGTTKNRSLRLAAM